MATTYYSTQPPSSNLSNVSSSTNTINVPDNYFLNVGNGKINTISEGDTIIDAGANVKIYADTDVLVNAIGGKVDVR